MATCLTRICIQYAPALSTCSISLLYQLLAHLKELGLKVQQQWIPRSFSVFSSFSLP